MKEDTKNMLVIVSSLLVMTGLAAVLITATGKILVLEVDGVSGTRGDSEGNYEEQRIDGGRFKFYAE